MKPAEVSDKDWEEALFIDPYPLILGVLEPQDLFMYSYKEE